MLRLRMATVILAMASAALVGCGDDEAGSGGGAHKETALDYVSGACQQQQNASGGAQCTGQDDYNACVESACQAGYTMCLGAGYKSGNYAGGPCEAHMKCVSAAPKPCESGCARDSACESCFTNNFASCAQGCISKLDCSGAAGGAGTGSVPNNGKTCADLQACCNSLEDATNKANCQQAYDNAKQVGDAFCGQIAASVCASAASGG